MRDSTQENRGNKKRDLKALGEFVAIYSGVSPSKVVMKEGGKFPFLKVEDLNNCEKYQTSSRFHTDDKKGFAPAGSVIFPKRGAAIMNNKVRIASVDVTMDTNLMAVLPNEQLDSEYFFYAIDYEGLYRIADTSTIPQLNNKHINPYEIHIPSIRVQKKIAAILRTWDEALEKLNALREAKAQQLGGLGLTLLDRAANEPTTVSKPLANLVRIVKGRQLNKLDITSGDYPVWNGGISPSGFHDEWNTEGGTITISEGGNSCGFVNLSDRRFWLGGHCYALQGLSSIVERDFLFHALKLREHEIMRLRVGSGLPNIQRADLEQLQVVVPALDLQKKIALALTAGNEELTLLDTEIEAISRQKRGLMQKLLTGEWRVEVSDGEEAAA